MKGLTGLIIAGAVLAVMLTVIGCSGATSPLDPELDNPPCLQPDENSGGCVLWGAWEIAIDTDTGSVDITQARLAEGCLNVLGFLEPPALTNLSIANLQLLPGQNRVNVDMRLTHPFTTNGQFHGFDVKGVVFGPTVLNTDGYTAWMNPADFSGVGFGYKDGLLGVPDSVANYAGADWGYKYFADGLAKNTSLKTFFATPANLSNRGLFSEGTTNTRHYQLDFGAPSKFLVFNYAVVANHAWPTGSPPYGVGNFSAATANGREAFNMEAYEVTNNIWYDPNVGIGGGTLDLDVEVWDWQGLNNTSVTVSATGLTPTSISAYTPGSTARSGIFSFNGLPFFPSSTNPITLTITAKDNSATFGSAWYMGLLPSSHQKYSANVYTKITKSVNVMPAGNYYGNTSVKDFVLWPYPHQTGGCCWFFADYYNFTNPPLLGRHDICICAGVPAPGQGTVKVIDTVGAGPAGPVPPGGGIIYDFPLPLGSQAAIPAPYLAGAASPPNLFPPWQPTRLDSSMVFETEICSANLNPYLFSPIPSPEYSVIQVYNIPPGAGGPPPIVDIDPFAMFPGAVPWDIGVDATNGFISGGQPGLMYGLFFFDYGIWANCGYPFGPPPGPALGLAWVYEVNLPMATITPVGLPTSFGFFGGAGPGVIDDSSAWGVCGSLAVDSLPINQNNLTLPNPTLVFVLDTANDIKIFEVDFTTGQFVSYGEIWSAYMGPGYMAADIEMIDTAKIAANNTPGYIPNTNLLAVAMVDGNPGPSQGDWWIDVYIVKNGNNASAVFTSTPINSGQPFLAMDVDETTGEIYVLHGSPSTPGSTAISVYKYF